MAMSSIGRPVVIDESNMRRFAEVASKPKPMVKPPKEGKMVLALSLEALRKCK